MYKEIFFFSSVSIYKYIQITQSKPNINILIVAIPTNNRASLDPQSLDAGEVNPIGNNTMNNVVDFTDLIATLRAFQENPKDLNEQQAASLQESISNINSILQTNGNNLPNVNLQTQRR